MGSNSGRALEVFTEAVQLSSEERALFLDRACAGDDQLRRKIEALLKSSDRAGDFLEEPPTGSIGERRAIVAAGEKPGDRIGRYKLIQQIGEGGCGVVFVAEQEEPVHRRVALKVIKPGMDTKGVIARFEAERQALALMDHPNIAHVFDAGATDNGRPYFVMELVDGVKISDYSDQYSLTLRERLELFVQVCDAIQHAHQKGIIHRDIKPSNVLVTKGPDAKPVPKVIDFGIAKATDSQQLTDKTIFTAQEMLIGTPAYMSPEQAALTSAHVDTRTDIYSLGVLLYELLTGTTPFDTHELLKAGFDEIRRAVREEEPVRPSTRLTAMRAADLAGVSKQHGAEFPTLIREMRGDLDWIVMKALEKDRTRRYATANGLAMDVGRYLAGETVLARPPSRLYQLRKLVSRHKLEFAAFALVTTTLVVGLIITTSSLTKEKKARDDADLARLDADDQRKKAQADERIALTEAARSREVTRFLRRMLDSADPGIALGRDDKTILRDLLDAAVKRLENELTNQPSVRADLKLTIGRVYGSLGQYDKTEPLVRDALGFHTNSPAGDKRQVAEALDILALMHQRQGKWEEAEQEGREALAIELSLQDEASMRLVARESHLAWTIVNLDGRAAEAESLFRKALAKGAGLVGEDSKELLDVKAGLGTALKRQNKLDDAEKLFRECITLRKRGQKVDDLDFGSEQLRLALVLERKGNLGEAEELIRQCLDNRRKILAIDHPLIDEALRTQMQVLCELGKMTEGMEAFRELLRIRRKRFGDHDRRVQDTIAGFTEVLVDGHNEIQFEQLARDYPWVRLVRSEYSARHLRWPDALAAASKFSEINPSDYLGYEFVALLLAQTGDRSAYEALCEKIVMRFAGTTEPLIADTMARVCLLLPRPNANLRVASELAARASAVGEKGPARPSIGMALAQYRQGRWDGAIEWARRAAEDPSPYSHAQATAILAMAQYQLKQIEVARASLKQCTEIVQTQLPKLKDGDLGRNWRDWIFAHSLQSEAHLLLEGVPTSTALPTDLPR